MTSLNVMVIDDEPAIRQIMSAFLRKSGYNVLDAAGGLAAFERLTKGDVDIAICDIKMPDLSGIELIAKVRDAGIDTSFIMMTAFASVDTAIEAIQAGASDYMIKPVRNQEVLHRLEKLADLRGLRAENATLRTLVQGANDSEFQFTAPCMRELERLINKVSPTDSTVLVTGDSGTGKGVIARRIHRQSQRAHAPFIPVNCGALIDNLIESELFGHIKGAFTGADKARKGLFLEADGGTIFLDEIGELPLLMQVKLLHAIEEKTVRAVGSEQSRRADVRIIAATNRDLAKMVAEGSFRQDLFFRLNVFQIHAPPLRQRKEDIPALIHFLLQRGSQRLRSGAAVTLDAQAERSLAAYAWPGNIRELENTLDRALILADDGYIGHGDLPAHISHPIDLPKAFVLPRDTPPPSDTSDNLRDQVRRFEYSLIQQAIAQAGGDRRVAAQKLGIGVSSLYRKLDELAAGVLPQDSNTMLEASVN